MKLYKPLLSLLLLLCLATQTSAQNTDLIGEIEELQLQAVNDTAFTLRTSSDAGNLVKYVGSLPLRINGELQEVTLPRTCR